MNTTEYRLRTIENKLDQLIDWAAAEEERRQKNQKDDNSATKVRYITLGEACRMLGVYQLSTLRAQKKIQPNEGNGIMIGRNKCFTAEQVEEWLNNFAKKSNKKERKNG